MTTPSIDLIHHFFVMQYYYLDGLDKKGPYTIQELQARNVNSETLVFSEGMDKWTPIKEVQEINDFINSKNQDAIISDVSIISTTPIDKLDLGQKQMIKKDKSAKIKIPSIAFLFLFFPIWIGLSYFFVSVQRQKDLELFNGKVEAIFGNNDAITDYKFDGTDGQLFAVQQTSLFGHGEDNVLKTSKRTLAVKPASNSYDQHEYDVYYANQQKQWDLFKGLVDYYESVIYTGFDVLHLEKDGSTFRITKSWSGDMAYKVPTTRHVEGYSGMFYTSPGYDVPTYRPPVNTCYEEAAKFLTVEREDKSYRPAAFTKISNFTNLESRFFEISQRFPKYTRLVNNIHVQITEKSEGDVVDKNKITDITGATDANVYTSQWIVWYKSITNTFSITEKNGVFNTLWLLYSIIGMAISLLTFFVLRLRKRITIE